LDYSQGNYRILINVRMKLQLTRTNYLNHKNPQLSLAGLNKDAQFVAFLKQMLESNPKMRKSPDTLDNDEFMQGVEI